VPLEAVISKTLELVVEGRWLFGEKTKRSTGKVVGASC
jgi:hypothetical protein